MHATHTVYTGVPAHGFAATARALSAPLATVAGIGAAAGVIYATDPTTPGNLPVLCISKLVGICCPGCGGMRMVYSVLHGDVGAALHYNAIALVLSALCVWSLVAWTRGRLRGRHMRSWMHWKRTPLVLGIVVGVWFVIRNLPFEPFSSLYV